MFDIKEYIKLLIKFFLLILAIFTLRWYIFGDTTSIGNIIIISIMMTSVAFFLPNKNN